jgi:hypothetical protein
MDMKENDIRFKIKLKNTLIREDQLEAKHKDLKRKLQICELKLKSVNDYREQFMRERYEKKIKVF